MRKLRARWPWILALATAGCVQAPHVAREPFMFESGRTPYSAAICISRNAKSLPDVTAEERLLGESAWEVVVRESTGAASTLAVAEAHNRATGSLVSLRVMRSQRGEEAAFARRLLADCQATMIAP